MIKEELSVDIQTIDAALLSKMFLAGAKNLEAKKEWINELNVFPVPDGDTGTNMTYDNYVCSKRSCCCGETGDERSCKSNFFRITARGKRKLRCYSFPAAPWVYKDDQAL